MHQYIGREDNFRLRARSVHTTKLEAQPHPSEGGVGKVAPTETSPWRLWVAGCVVGFLTWQ